MAGLFSKLLSIGSDKQVKELEDIAKQVANLEKKYRGITQEEALANPELEANGLAEGAMSDEELAAQTQLFKDRLASEDNPETLDDILPEAFAVVREASRRVLGMRHFDVQVMGGAALHRGMIAEMKTGEGKTLVSTLAGYLNALAGKGVHIVTVNDYLARRDSEWMGNLYRFLGMNVGLLQNGMDLKEKPAAYAADVTYGTNTEFGFDYLRDNMAMRKSDRVQRGHYFAIVDEVDSILIDEARTPLIISDRGTKVTELCRAFAKAVKGLTQAEEPEHDPFGGPIPEPDGDFLMDEGKHTIAATEQGLRKIEKALSGVLGDQSIYDDPSGQLANYLQQALRAEYMYHRDKDYVVTPEREVKIVDEFTGRIMEGRRWSDGLHQAVEAKENVPIHDENQTAATITLQNYFRLYEKLSGMTGTAMTEDAEFREIYKLNVVEIPPNRPVIRTDNDDVLYRTIDYKFNAVAEDIQRRHAAGQPVLVGTVSIESSERLSRLLKQLGIEHEILNAKFHEREAQIVAQAGREGAVTIATNMAGRGTDILLGGNPVELAEDILRAQGIDPADEEHWTEEEKATAAKVRADAAKTCAEERKRVLAAGGLAVIGTERHESRRIDNQLRGRSGRQGDPGETQFYLSLEDDLMRLFGQENNDRIDNMLSKLDLQGVTADLPLVPRVFSKRIEDTQRKVEQINYAMRKNVLDYDDVMNQQRQVIYEERNKILDGKDLTEHVSEIIASTVERNVREFCPEGTAFEDWEQEGLLDLRHWLTSLTGVDGMPEISKEFDTAQLVDATIAYVTKIYDEHVAQFPEELKQQIAASVMLKVIDARWRSYLQEMDYLKVGIGLRSYGQRDPLVEYKQEAYALFAGLIDTMYEDFLRIMMKLTNVSADARAAESEQARLKNAQYSGPAELDGEAGAAKMLLRPQKQAAPVMHAAQRDINAPAPKASAEKPHTYRKADDPNPYVGVGRNDPCPCGSGKKFKNCHGRNQ